MAMTTDIGELGTILGVWAHPDDETYLSAGLMAAAVRNGQRVVCITATRGEAGSWDEVRWPSATMGKVREGELMTCFDILGVTEHHWLDYIDAKCIDVDSEEATARVAAFIADVQPDTVLTFGPEGMTDHADHKCVCGWTTDAFDRAAKAGARLHYATQTPEWAERWVPILAPRNVFEGDTPPRTPRSELSIDFELTPDLLELKEAAIGAHASQIEGMAELFGADWIRQSQGAENFRLARVR
jgi:LmbE family N-acetylglucosaminyl deacetylase